ncbi:MAG: hypothetical protein LBG60_09360 [Bifidobacteriaceae bacterium]|jgi:hypothetical protein|nr:hypothetical protein [Bifidobacteriaceae bacterium]
MSVIAEPPLTALVPASLLFGGERRMEARSYLSDGYGIGQRIAALPATARFGQLADVWQPPRLKGYAVPEGKGTPFLSAGQAFELRPRARKWLSEATVPHYNRRLVEAGWLLLSCSGQVGRVTAVYPHHAGKVMTHDLLRLVPENASDYGWLYAYMRTPQFLSVARAAQYGAMIKHLDPGHVNALPVPLPPPSVRRRVGQLAERAVGARREASALLDRADRLYEALINPAGVALPSRDWGPVPARRLFEGRRRLDGQHWAPRVKAVEALLAGAATHGVDTVAGVTRRVELGNRFKRSFGPKGTPYYSASDLFDVNASATKRVYAGLLKDASPYYLRAGWIVMACSGQAYGLLGRSLVLGEQHEGVFGSHDLIRIEPDPVSIRTGYLQTVLSNETYGRLLVVRHAFGTTVPHLDPVDIRAVPVPRFSRDREAEVADSSEQAFAKSAEADRLENLATRQAAEAIQALLGEKPGAN